MSNQTKQPRTPFANAMVIGDFQIGKTTLTKFWCGIERPVRTASKTQLSTDDDLVQEQDPPEVDLEDIVKKFNHEKTEYDIKFRDSAGMERNCSIAPQFYNELDVLVIVVGPSASPPSSEKDKKNFHIWFEDFFQKSKESVDWNPREVPVFLISLNTGASPVNGNTLASPSSPAPPPFDVEKWKSEQTHIPLMNQKFEHFYVSFESDNSMKASLQAICNAAILHAEPRNKLLKPRIVIEEEPRNRDCCVIL